MKDFMDAPALAERGGILHVRAMFGTRLPALLEELTEALAA
jgi:type I restriction enzyme, R subunit